MASHQKNLGNLEVGNKHWILFRMVLFMHSIMTFCWELRGLVFSCLMTCFIQYSSNAFEVYSPPSSVLKHFNFFPISLSTRTWNSSRWSSTSSLVFMVYAHTFLDASSMEVKKQDLEAPLDVIVSIEPHTSEYSFQNFHKFNSDIPHKRNSLLLPY